MSLTIPVKTAFVLSWTLTDSNNNPINTAVVTANLYAGRSVRDPDALPGTLVPPIEAVNLAYVPSSAGLYSASIPGTLDPPLDGVGYVLVIDGTVLGVQVYHTEQLVVIETAGDTIDLTTVDLVKNRATVQGTTDDAEIQAAITGFSQYLLNWSGQASLNSIASLDELYDGNGNNILMLRSWPIQSLISVTIDGSPVPIASGGNWGVLIAPSKRWLKIRSGVGGYANFPYSRYLFGPGNPRRGPQFSRGTANIEVQYTAGYADTPADLEYAVRCVVAINYKRKGWQDQASKGITNTGASSTTRYMNWAWPPEYDRIFEQYRRLATPF